MVNEQFAETDPEADEETMLLRVRPPLKQFQNFARQTTAKGRKGPQIQDFMNKGIAVQFLGGLLGASLPYPSVERAGEGIEVCLHFFLRGYSRTPLYE
jgi:hypothetical protein